jgi:hypothetical protein
MSLEYVLADDIDLSGVRDLELGARAVESVRKIYRLVTAVYGVENG